ncbi:hypothetical protein [Paenibacillus silvae]|uniref:Uncharacterized protein n=1 Tax=Paenibacillus silvae TaxID=1325358 RepID=A0A2W6NFJ8_9BACL|nr:hypothetical protein [Paenibacillus silvae]PZT54744.1 hypothetical protein DN757_15870 [Paenibacillus silvae]
MKLSIFKKLTFWFVLFSLLICFNNLSGNDDKNILIYLTNPFNPFLNKWLTGINTNPETTYLFRPLIYGLHLLFWTGLGLIIDKLIKKDKNKKHTGR